MDKIIPQALVVISGIAGANTKFYVVTPKAPTGMGLVMIPAMVVTNIANRCHAFISTHGGGGVIQISTPIPIVIIQGVYLFFFSFSLLKLSLIY